MVSIKHLVTMRFCLSIGAALAVTGTLVANRGDVVTNPEGPGIVYVYFPSMCAAPGDGRDCQEIKRISRPSFDSMAACSAYADIQLRNENNPRLMASCLKQREV
jgi:hypothetical protein